jgi:hypothetical protein
MSRVSGIVLVVLSLVPSAELGAQWLNEPTKGIPRTADGKPNLTAPAPRTADHRPDLSGIWQLDPGPYVNNVAVDLKSEELRPGVDALYKQRMEDLGKENPALYRCLPVGPRALYYPQGWVRVIQTPSVIALLYEDLTWRQIFMDGRPLPKDPHPSFMGYSVGRWEGDTLVVDSIGFNDASWLDYGGHPHSEALRTTERITRTSIGRLDIQIQFDDPKVFTRAFTVPLRAELVTDTEMLEYVCNENPKSFAHHVGKLSDDKKFAVKVAPQILSKYVGAYLAKAVDGPGQMVNFNVTLSGDTLSMDIDGKDKQEMIPLSDELFSVVGIRVNFVKEKDAVTHLILHMVEGDMTAVKKGSSPTP